MLTATPSLNLVTNIGTGPSATNTRDVEENKHGQEARDLRFPLIHPSSVMRSDGADQYAQRHAFGIGKDNTFRGRLIRLGKKFLEKVFPK
jgi:hypothetical protein